MERNQSLGKDAGEGPDITERRMNMISDEILSKFTEKEIQLIKSVNMWPPRRKPWTEKDLRLFLKFIEISFPEAVEDVYGT